MPDTGPLCRGDSYYCPPGGGPSVSCGSPFSSLRGRAHLLWPQSDSLFAPPPPSSQRLRGFCHHPELKTGDPPLTGLQTHHPNAHCHPCSHSPQALEVHVFKNSSSSFPTNCFFLLLPVQLETGLPSCPPCQCMTGLVGCAEDSSSLLTSSVIPPGLLLPNSLPPVG